MAAAAAALAVDSDAEVATSDEDEDLAEADVVADDSEDADDSDDADDAGEDVDDVAEADAGEDGEAEEEEDPAAEMREALRRAPGEWYVVHSYAGYENKVKTNLETRIGTLDMEDYIFQFEVKAAAATE